MDRVLSLFLYDTVRSRVVFFSFLLFTRFHKTILLIYVYKSVNSSSCLLYVCVARYAESLFYFSSLSLSLPPFFFLVCLLKRYTFNGMRRKRFVSDPCKVCQMW